MNRFLILDKLLTSHAFGLCDIGKYEVETIGTINCNLLGQSFFFDSVSKYYLGADAVICDSYWISKLANWFGLNVTHMPGSDFIATAVMNHYPIVAFGSFPPEFSLPQLKKIDTPFFAHEDDIHAFLESPAIEAILADIYSGSACNVAPLIAVCVGARKQEILAVGLAQKGLNNIICVGASFDFLSGSEQRCPEIYKRLGLEWWFRLVQNPGKKFVPALIYAPVGLVATLCWIVYRKIHG